MMNAKKISLIKNNRSTLSISGGNKNATYLIGFSERKVANYVCNNITSKPVIGLHPVKSYDVNKSMDITQNVNIHIDTTLRIYKKPKEYNVSDKLYVEECDLLDFMQLPTHQSIGVIIPEFIIEEDEYAMHFKCQMIDPSGDLKIIRENFQKIFNGN